MKLVVGDLFWSWLSLGASQETGATCWPIAHRNAAISRAMAAMMTGVFLPLAASRRNRAQRRTWAFQAMSRIAFGSFSDRRCSLALTRAGYR